MIRGSIADAAGGAHDGGRVASELGAAPPAADPPASGSAAPSVPSWRKAAAAAELAALGPARAPAAPKLAAATQGVLSKSRAAWELAQQQIAERMGVCLEAPAAEPSDAPPPIVPPPPRVSAGAADPLQADASAAELAEQQTEAAELAEQQRAAIVAELGQWTKDSETRLARLEPTDPQERRDAAVVTRRVWCVGRMTVCGGLPDLAYAVSCMQLDVNRPDVFGAFVAEATGMQPDGSVRRQLYSMKARRKLVRSYVLYMSGVNARLCDIAGSPSKLPVRGVKRLPQRLLARICAVGGRLWSRATTTRDANESHRAGLWHRVRLPVEHADPRERNGRSGQVVSRYWLKRPTAALRLRSSSTSALGGVLGRLVDGGGAQRAAERDWICHVARHALRFARHGQPVVKPAEAIAAWVSGLLEPLTAAAPS